MFVGYLLANHLISLGIIVLNPYGKMGREKFPIPISNALQSTLTFLIVSQFGHVRPIRYFLQME